MNIPIAKVLCLSILAIVASGQTAVDESTTSTTIIDYAGFSPSHARFFSHPIWSAPDGTSLDHKPLWGLNYGARNGKANDSDPLFGCPAKEDILRDLELMRPFTSRLRIFSLADCQQGAIILEAAKTMNFSILAGLWISGNRTAFEMELAELRTIATTIGLQSVMSVVVGNEVLFRGEMNETSLLEWTSEVREILEETGFAKIPISIAEVRNLFSERLIQDTDFILVNSYPYWEGVPIEIGVRQLFRTLDLEVQSKNVNTSSYKPVVLGEVGWPSNGFVKDGAVPSITNMMTYLEQFVCAANSRHLRYFWFAAFDEPWKQNSSPNDTEGFWGLYDKERNLKPEVAQVLNSVSWPWSCVGL